MDEKEYRDLYHSVNTTRCAFEKAVLTRRFGCSKLAKINIGDREAASCTDPEAQQDCMALLDLLRTNAAFVLKITHVSGSLPHAKEIRVQCGGLKGLTAAMYHPDDLGSGVRDIYGLIKDAHQLFGDLEQLPFPEIIRSISLFQGRKRGR